MQLKNGIILSGSRIYARKLIGFDDFIGSNVHICKDVCDLRFSDTCEECKIAWVDGLCNGDLTKGLGYMKRMNESLYVSRYVLKKFK